MKSKKSMGQKELMYTLLAILIMSVLIIMYVVLKDKIFAILE